MDNVLKGPSNRQGLALGLIRILLGVWFLWSGIPKLKAAYFNEQLETMLPYFAEQGAVGFYKGFLTWAAGHAKVFAYLTAFGEVAAGAALVLGLLTPLALAAIVFMCANYLLATVHLGPAPVGVNFLCITTGIALIVGRAGRFWGLDAKFGKKGL